MMERTSNSYTTNSARVVTTNTTKKHMRGEEDTVKKRNMINSHLTGIRYYSHLPLVMRRKGKEARREPQQDMIKNNQSINVWITEY